MSTLRHQSPCFRGGQTRQGPAPRTGGWKFSCPPRLLKLHAPTDRTRTAGPAIRGRPRPEGPHTAATAASPLPPTTPPAHIYQRCVRHSFAFPPRDGCGARNQFFSLDKSCVRAHLMYFIVASGFADVIHLEKHLLFGVLLGGGGPLIVLMLLLLFPQVAITVKAQN